MQNAKLKMQNEFETERGDGATPGAKQRRRGVQERKRRWTTEESGDESHALQRRGNGMNSVLRTTLHKTERGADGRGRFPRRPWPPEMPRLDIDPSPSRGQPLPRERLPLPVRRIDRRKNLPDDCCIRQTGGIIDALS